MASRTQKGGGSTALAFILGAVFVVAIVIGWRVWGDSLLAPEPPRLDMRLPESPALPSPAPMPNPQPTPLPGPPGQ